MKKHLILGLTVLITVLGLGLVNQTFASTTTATPTILTIGGYASNGTVYINRAASTSVAVTGTVTATTSATTTVWLVFKDASTHYATSTGTVAPSGTTFSITATNLISGSLADAATVSLKAYAQAGVGVDEATSTATTTTNIILDTVVPTLSSITMYSNNSTTTVAKAGNIVTLIASSSEVGTPVISIAGHSSTVTGSYAAGFVAPVTMAAGDTTGSTTISFAFTDSAGNPAVTATNVSSGLKVTFYGAPVVTINGLNPMRCNIGWACSDDSATAVDSFNVNIPLTTVSTVNTAIAGNYTRIYSALTDRAGNAVSGTRNVYIVKKSTGKTIINDTTTDTSSSQIVTTPTVSPTTTTNNSSTTNAITTTENSTTTEVIVSNEVPVTVVNVSGATETIKRQLKSGVSGADVKLLQILLSHDSSVYPEGLTTGFFGNLTQKAVQKFQLKYNIVLAGGAGYGQVGPKTKVKLIEIYGK